jgi:radical SAM superfamily enzyme YgiQ (UPF0313 family)
VLDGSFDVSITAERLAECDIVGVSYFVWNTHASDRVCAEIKRINPDCLIVYGGLGTPKYGRCGEFLLERPFIDVIVHNEGELVFEHLLRAIVNNEDFQTVKGITTRKFQTPLGDRIRNISEMPSPYLDGLFDDLEEIKDHDYKWESLIELERGCPYTCSFCEVGDRHWTKIIKQDYDKMMKEINWVSDHKIDYLHLIDNNFGMYKNHRIISDLLIDKLETTGYPNALNITWAKHKKPYLFDIAEDLWKVGLNKSVTIALQSMNYQTLKAVERANENTNLKEVVAYLKTRGMPAYIETILGLPEETLDSFKEGLFRLIDEIDYHNYIGIYVMVALPNTPFGDPEYLKQYGVKIMQTSPAFFHHDHPPEELMKDVNDVVVGSDVMSFDDYIEATLWKWYMISFHFLGWLRILAFDLKNQYAISHRTFYTELFTWCMSNPRTLLFREYHITKRLLKKVFERKIPWGRKVSDVSLIYWEYEEATAIHIVREKYRFYDEIGNFIEDQYSIDRKILNIQYKKMKDPYKVYNGDLEKWARECMWWGRRSESFFV